MGEHVKLQAADGHELDGYVARPAGEPKGALVVVQEIFGINQHIRSVVDKFAAEGYLAIAPAIFDRYERGVELLYDGGDAPKAMELYGKLMDNLDDVLADLQAGIDYLTHESKGTRIGVVGYCFGGSAAWLAAGRLPIDAAVAYYGGAIPKLLKDAPKVPIILHFGLQDDHIAMSDVNAIIDAYPEMPVYFYEAGHGFNCDMRSSYDATSSKLALERTLDFLDEHLAGVEA